MKQLVAGIVAHVDAGKTTLSEAMLYESGSIRKLGRVDRKDAFLDHYAQERARGITIFSKQARILHGDTEITLLDTPGHVDFSAEMERTLWVLDAAVLVISASAGIQGHTRTLWKLLKSCGIPVFIFVNKMDQPDTDREAILEILKAVLSEYCIDLTCQESEAFYENIACSDETVLDAFLDTGKITTEQIQRLTGERKIFPCFFGSALKLSGVEELLDGLTVYTEQRKYPETFGARIFKITRDDQKNRLTHMKITGGRLRAREILSVEGQWEEKVNQIRVYSGEKYETLPEAGAGRICAVTGLTRTRAGERLGFEAESGQVYRKKTGEGQPDGLPGSRMSLLSPVLSYRVVLPDECDPALMLPKLRQLEEEDPQLHIVWEGKSREIHAQLMGKVQMEVLGELIRERFGVSVSFGQGSIVYRETIADRVEGVGHFEPLRHYAEVHLLLEPGEEGSGLQITSDCSVDELDLNWQRLILTHLEEKEHQGVLTGAGITDMKITLKSGRVHLKHTEGGDFRQATYRALRQGLMQAKSILLEPWYEFRLEVPLQTVGRAMADLDKMQGSFTLEQRDESAVLKGTVPVAAMQDYPGEVAAYTKGMGQLWLGVKGYYPCHNTEEVLEETGYDPLRDAENPAGSIFCSHGAGFYVEWDQVADYMHLESCLKETGQSGESLDVSLNETGRAGALTVNAGRRIREKEQEAAGDTWIGTEEVDEILSRAVHANKKQDRAERRGWQKPRREGEREWSCKTEPDGRKAGRSVPLKESYLLVDGYNVIFAWEELKELAERNLDGARGALLDLLCNYQALKGCSVIAVFDAYRLAGHATEVLDYHNIHVVFTREAETADQYIEKFAHENSHKYDVTVATSDGLEQIIIVGEGCRLLSSRELKEEIEQICTRSVQDFRQAYPGERLFMEGVLSQGAVEEIERFRDHYEQEKQAGGRESGV